MAPVAASADEAIVAEADDMPAMVLVELGPDARPARPTIVVEQSEPPNWKPTPVAQAWVTVGRGLDLMRWGLRVALLQPIAVLTMLVLSWCNVVSLAPTASATTSLVVLTYAIVAVGGWLLVAGRLCCYRVPPKTGARLLMAGSCIGTVLATAFTLLTSLTWVVPSGDRGPFASILFVGQWVTLGLWLATEWAFLWGVGQVGHFVKRPGLARFACAMAVATAVFPILAALVLFVFVGETLALPIIECLLAGLLVLYLFLLGAARRAVSSKTPDENSVLRASASG
jgi:hypothetical protein